MTPFLNRTWKTFQKEIFKHVRLQSKKNFKEFPKKRAREKKVLQKLANF